MNQIAAFTTVALIAPGFGPAGVNIRTREDSATTPDEAQPEENRELFACERLRGEWKSARYMFNKTS